MTNIPQSVLESGFDFNWDEKDVWALNYPPQEISIDQLAWHFAVPFWNWAGQEYVLTPNQVMAAPQKYQAEYDRIMAADTAYPIDVMENKGRLVILDGLHRLAKLKLQGCTQVPVRIIPRSEIKNIAK
ncbi:ParB-like nuclease domain-containing protein [bacterium]|nr:ParB-like nuclease domain-containing protein [bacterium]